MTVRAAEPGDLPRVLELNTAAVPAVNAISAENLAWFHKVGWLWVIDEQVEPPGTVGAFLLALGPGLEYPSLNYQWFSQRYANFLYIDRVVVDPAWQRRGFGRLLYERARAFARRRGNSHLLCEVNLRPRNEASLAFHLRFGMEPVGEQETEGGTKRVQMFALPLRPVGLGSTGDEADGSLDR